MAVDLGHFEKVRALAAGARFVVVGGVRAGAASQVTAFEPASNKKTWTADLPAHVLGICAIEEAVLCACSDGQIRALRTSSGEALWSAPAHVGGATAIAASPDGASFATAGVDGSVRVWSTAKHEVTATYELSAQALHAVGFAPDGSTIAAAGDDGVVRSVTLADGSRREMPGHEGAVRALAFTPRDGRIASGGEDGTIRFHYLAGPIEHETRGTDDTGHAGGVLALVFGPTPPLDKDGEDPGDRLFSAGADGKVRMWRLGDRRKPRSYDLGGAVAALAIAPAPRGSTGALGSLIAAGDARTLYRFTLDATSTPDGTALEYRHGIALLEATFSAQRPAREAAVKALVALDEVEGRELLAKYLGSDRDAAVRTLAAQEIEAKGRRDLLPAIRERLNDGAWQVREAAYSALRAMTKATPLTAIRAAMASHSEDVHRRALAELSVVGKGSPIARPMAAAALTNSHPAVRLAALDALVALEDPGSPAPLRAAFTTGTLDVRVDVLWRVAAGGEALRGALSEMLARALDDEWPDVRRAAFLVSVLGRPLLAVRLFEKDGDLARAFAELSRRAAELARPRALPVFGPEAAAVAPSEDALAAARSALLGSVAAAVARATLLGKNPPESGAPLAETDLAPLVAAASCRFSDTALAGAAALAQLGDERALGALLQLSRDPDAKLRRKAAGALGALGGPHAEKRIVRMLDDAEADVRAAAYDALSQVRKDAPTALIDAALRSSQQDIRVRGLALLMREAEKQTPGAAELLGDAIEDEAADVRREALRTLWVLQKNEPGAVIDRALAARFPDVRRRAVDELAARKKEAGSLQKLAGAIADRDADVATAAYDALVEIAGKEKAEAHLAAVASVHAQLREKGARGAVHASEADVQRALTKLLEDEASAVRVAAIESLDRLLKTDAAPLRLGLQSSHLDLRVRAAELCATRGEAALLDPMRALLLDKDLKLRIPAGDLLVLRRRATSALATLGDRSTVRFFVDLLKDDDAGLREQAARGLANACRRGDEGHLLDALGHADVPVRSWAADGLSRLGDARALPVLVGNLRHPHLPIRLGAVLSFAALGPEGYSGMLQGLEDAVIQVQEIVFFVVLARDLRAARRGEAPDLLATALAAASPEIRFAAARALELRHDSGAYLAHLVEALLPPKPEKAADMKDWPANPKRAHIAVGLAEALAGDRPEQRYAAAQVLVLREKPRDFFREAEKVAKPRLASSPWIADTTPRAAEETDAAAKAGWLRKLFSDGVEGAKSASGDPDPRLLALAFGAYVGLVRSDAAGEEGHRVRRDAVDRIAAHALEGKVAREIAVAPLVRALADAHHLVRKAALAALQRVLAPDAETPLALALGSSAGDVARAALDELAKRGDNARSRIAEALNSQVADVRRYAFELLEKLSPKGSLEPLLWALGSDHTDMRLGVLDRLASAADARVDAALGKAAESDHTDVRLRAAELLAERKDERATDVLAGLLRSDDAAVAQRAEEALVKLGSAPAAEALGVRCEEGTTEDRRRITATFSDMKKTEAAIRVLVGLLRDDDSNVRESALEAGLALVGEDTEEKKSRDHALAATLLIAAARAKDAAIRLQAAGHLKEVYEPSVDAALASLLGDRDAAVRKAAAESYAWRVVEKGAPIDPLASVVSAGTRDLLLSAAEGVASRGLVTALRPLLLFARAGELAERSRALVALGGVPDKRAFDELMSTLASGTPEEPLDPALRAAAIEGVGKAHNKLADPEAARRARDTIDDASRNASSDISIAAVRALRHIGGEFGRTRLEILLAPGGDDDVRVEAAEALGLLGDLAAETALAVAVTDTEDNVCIFAKKALDKLFPSEKTRVALHALSSPCTEVAEPAATYLATEGDPAVLLLRLPSLESELAERLRFGLLRRPALPSDALGSLLANPSPAAREGAAWLLGARAETSPKGDAASLSGALVSAATTAAQRWSQHAKASSSDLRDAEADAWSRALWAGGRLKIAAIAPAARAALELTDAPTAVRAEAARTLGLLGSAGDASVLVTASRDRDASVRAASFAALAAGSPAQIAAAISAPDADRSALARYAKADAATLSSAAARPLGLRAALASHDTAALLALVTNASADRAARLDAVDTLGRAGGEAEQKALSALAFDKALDEAFRKAAYRALRRARRNDAQKASARAVANATTTGSEVPS